MSVFLPRLLYNEGMMGQAAAVLGGHLEGARQLWLRQRLQLFTASHVRQRLDTQQQQGQQQQRKVDGDPAADPSSSSSSGSSSNLKLLVLGPRSDPCFWSGFSFAVFSGLSPGQVEAAAAADPFQSWELAFSGRRGAAAAAAWQQRWQEYGMGQLQWQQQVQQLRRQQRQQQQQQEVKREESGRLQGSWGVAAQHSQSLVKGVQAAAGGVLPRAQVLVLTEQQHSELQQQLLQLPPSKTALSNGKSLRLRRLLLLVDDVAAASSAACSSSRGRALRQQRAVWSNADRQQLQAIQQQQQLELEDPQGGSAVAVAVQRLLADGISSSTPAAAAAAAGRSVTAVQELGELLPPLVLSVKRRLLEATLLLRSMWGALIPPVLSPPVALVCNAAGLVAQQAALTAAPW
jgi:hypothetical protein